MSALLADGAPIEVHPAIADIRSGFDGQSVPERERKMIEECDSAIIIWHDNSGVIAENLEILKRVGKPTYIYEYHSTKRRGKAGWLDSSKVYDPYYRWKEYMRSQNGVKSRHWTKSSEKKYGG